MFGYSEENAYLCTRKTDMVPVVQLVRASDCGSECRRFESVRAPKLIKPGKPNKQRGFPFFYAPKLVSIFHDERLQ